MDLSFGSVCSGIEAASVAWHPLGWRAVWLAEVDKAASEVLAFRFPDVPNHGDMLLLAAKVRRREIPAPDMLVGGTPCQAFSVAGRRQGLDDARGQLTIAFIDLADAIDEIRAADGKPPVIIVWENVPGVLNVKGNAFGCFLAGLSGESDELQPAGRKWTHAGCVLGPQRAVAWRVLDAQYFGLAQRRNRVFVVASAMAGFHPAAVLFEREGVRRDSPPSREAGQIIAGTLDARTDGGGFPGTDGACANHVVAACRDDGDVGEESDFESLLGRRSGQPDGRLISDDRVFPTLDASMDRKWGSNQWVDAGQFVLEPVAFSSKDYGQDASLDLSPTLRSGTHSDSHANGGCPPAVAYESIGFNWQNGGGYGNAEDGLGITHEATGPLQVSQTPAVAYAIQDGSGREKQQNGFGIGEDVGYTLDTTGHQSVAYAFQPRIARNGHGDMGDLVNALTAQAGETGKGDAAPCVAYMPARTFAKDGEVDTRYAEREICDALHTSSGHGNKAPLIADMAVRRLMPVECERLQGFPDNWTLVPTGPKRKPAADGPRYKQCGNSMAVNCMRWIGRRIAAHLATIAPANDDFDCLIGDEFDALLA